MAPSKSKSTSTKKATGATGGGAKKRASSGGGGSSKASGSKLAAKASKASPASSAANGKGTVAKADGGGGGGGGPRYFLMKSEPDTFSIQQLAALPNQTSCWEGVRNYQARNIMRDQMRVGDQAFFYHSSCKVPGVVGLVEIVKEAYPDHFQFDKASEYYDAGSSKESPRWLMVDVQLKETLPHMVTLEELRAEAAKPHSPLQGMLLLQRGSRLSVQPVAPAEWKHIMGMIEAKKQQPK